MEILPVVILLIIVFGWGRFYRWAFFPKRDPDFEHRVYVYWFDEKVAYSGLASNKKLRFFEKDGILYEDFGTSTRYTELFNITGRLPIEVQEAYKQHVLKKFEEIVLK